MFTESEGWLWLIFHCQIWIFPAKKEDKQDFLIWRKRRVDDLRVVIRLPALFNHEN